MNYGVKLPHGVRVKYRVGNFMAGVVLITDTSLWAIQVGTSLTLIGEVIAEILGFFQVAILGAWFFLCGIHKGGNFSKKLLSVFIADVIEIIPFVNDIPAEILDTVYLIWLTRHEDRKMALQKYETEQREQEELIIAQQQYRAFVEARRARLEAANDDTSDELAAAA